MNEESNKEDNLKVRYLKLIAEILQSARKPFLI